ncbi:MAG TPA: TonB-dependent receptor [Longimicrobiaceae bacterium]|nr:TonB-dependent receptor [Longimicrobiaceae bacterium]
MALLLALLAPLAAAAQATGRVEGRVLDAASGAPLAGARVQVQGGVQGANTDAEGRFAIARVPAGSHVLAATLLGRAPQTRSVAVPGAGVARVEFRLAPQAVQLGAVTARAPRQRGGLSQALEQQRTALAVVSNLSAEQIARSPDSDAAQAVQRVSGVTLQDGRYVFVRGLGERYSTTSLNGARIPSPEPDRRVVPLDLFPAAVLEGITVSKTFTPDQPGDFSGAQVNLRTRDFPARPTRTFTFSAGLNDAASFRSVVAAPTVGPEWLAFAGDERGLPAGLEGGQLPQTDAEQAGVLRSFRNVWSAEEGSGRPNVSMSGSLGGQGEVFGRPLGYVASLSYGASQEVRKDERRALAVSAGLEGGTRPQNLFTGTTGRHSVLWGGIVNLSLQAGQGSRLFLNNTYDRTADNEAIRLLGFTEEFGRDVDVTRLVYTERALFASQLGGDHIFGGRHRVEWAATVSGVERNEPDLSDLVYERITTGAGEEVFAWGGGTRQGTRGFSDLAETSYAGEASYTLRFGDDVDAATLKLGGLGRTTRRDASLRLYDILNRTLSDAERAQPAEELFAGAFDPGDLRVRLEPNVNGGAYTADEDLGAGYAMVDLPLRSRLRLVAGARVEGHRLQVIAQDVSGRPAFAGLRNLDVLPALALNWQPTDWQQVRLSATQTLSRPEYRELAPITWPDPYGGQIFFGNPTLKRARVQNFDLRWELYPTPTEFLGVALFAKRFDDPIERILVLSTGTNRVSFVNTESALNYGVELEARKGLGFLAGALDPVVFFANATFVRSDITIGNRDVVGVTNNERPMTGQAPYVVNLGLTYTSDAGRRSATLLYNLVGERIWEVGTAGLPDAYEQPRHVLDLSLSWPLLRAAALKLDAENLLDAPYELTQGEVVRHRYTTGRTFSLGVQVRR